MAKIGWVVDCQRDFMDPDGRLYVRDLGDASDPGAKQIVGRLTEAVGWMREHCALVVYTGDWHGHNDAEIDSLSPDPTKGTYPPHCMGRSEDPDERKGAEVIDAIAPANPVVLPVDAAPAEGARVAHAALDQHRDVFIQKNRFDVFAGNAATDAFVDALGRKLGGHLEFIVIGVARDVCVTQAVDGLQARSFRTAAIRDATWGLGLEAESATLARWRSGGAVLTLDELRSPTPGH